MNRATTSLVLGIVSIVCCALVGPVAWYMGQQELNNIKSGAGAQSDKGLATAGMVLGIIGTVLLILSLLWIFFFGGLAFIGALSESAR